MAQKYELIFRFEKKMIKSIFGIFDLKSKKTFIGFIYLSVFVFLLRLLHR